MMVEECPPYRNPFVKNGWNTDGGLRVEINKHTEPAVCGTLYSKMYVRYSVSDNLAIF